MVNYSQFNESDDAGKRIQKMILVIYVIVTVDIIMYHILYDIICIYSKLCNMLHF